MMDRKDLKDLQGVRLLEAVARRSMIRQKALLVDLQEVALVDLQEAAAGGLVIVAALVGVSSC